MMSKKKDDSDSVDERMTQGRKEVLQENRLGVIISGLSFQSNSCN